MGCPGCRTLWNSSRRRPTDECRHLTFSYARYPWVDNNSPDYVSRDKPEPLFIDGTDKIKWRMAYQLTALGVSLGSDNFHLFGELGYGSLGIVRVGLGIAL